MSIYKDKILSQILDGTKSWQVKDRPAEDLDLFEVEVVLPLRELRDEGRIDTEEVTAPVSSGGYKVKAVFLRNILRLGDDN